MITGLMERRALAPLTLLSWLAFGTALSAQEPQFRAPILCDPGKDCWVSTFFDHDPGPGHKDQACGPVTYDTHGGIDFAIPNLAAMEQGVTVVASAPGVVVGTRDDMADVSIRDIDPATLGGKDCGNGARIDHGNGWHSQYCHLKRGSIRVRSKQRVEAGTPLGLVGLSGRTEHPHVHMSVFKDGKKLDPYTGSDGSAGCGTTGKSLWHPSVLRDFPYRTGLVRDLVFTLRVPERKEIQAGTAGVGSGSTGAEVIVLAAETMANLRDHRVEMRILAPGGQTVVEKTHDQPKVYAYTWIGRKRPGPGWPAGSYRGEVTVRDGKGQVTDSREITLELR